MTADAESPPLDASSPSISPSSPSSISFKGLLGSERELQEPGEGLNGSSGAADKRLLGNLWFDSKQKFKPMGVFLNSTRSFKRLEAAREEISEQTPSPPLSSSLRLRDGINLPMVGEVRWDLLKQYALNWLRNPKNLALLVWIIAVAVSGAILFLVMAGMLDSALPNKKDRDVWFEVNNQILNALFTLMCVYVHPLRFMHLYMLYRWQRADIIALRKIYCKNGTRKPHEWAHMMVVVILLHMNCFFQYALCCLNWGYKRSKRPAIGVAVCLSFAIGCAAAAGIYNIVSPLGKDYAEEEADETTEALDKCEQGVEISRLQSSSGETKRMYWLLEKRASFASREGKLVENPEWQGGLFDFRDHPGSAFVSAVCCFCVFGWNMDRLGFGNRYVHIVTFLLLCSAPFFVLNLAAVNIDNETVRRSLGIGGIALSIFGLMYGGYWRIKMRETFKLPARRWCCNHPDMTDCTQWLFCSVCSLCQEVRTAEHYQVKDEKFYLQPSAGTNRADYGSPGPSPLGREAPQPSPFPPPSIHSPSTLDNSVFSAPFSRSPQSAENFKESEFPRRVQFREHPMVAPEPVKIEIISSPLRS